MFESNQRRIFITGATGFIGRSLVLRLQREGHAVTALVRNRNKALSLLGPDVRFVKFADAEFSDAVGEADAIFNLAGDPLLGKGLFGKRWDEKKRASIWSSRIDLTKGVVNNMTPGRQNRVFISTSAVGYYGNGGNLELTESSPAGTGFLADLCASWEAEASKASKHGVRVAILRIGVVLGRGGGALSQMLPIFRAGLGGPIGSGKQFVPWIHQSDLIELLMTALHNPAYEGAFNATAPSPVTFKTFAKKLGSRVGRLAIVPVPGFGLRLLYGDAAQVLTEGQNATPKRAMEMGFQFGFSRLKEALRDVVGDQSVRIKQANGSIPESPYLANNPPKYVLQTKILIPAPRNEVFAFFSQPKNLGVLTPSAMKFRSSGQNEDLGTGAIVEHTFTFMRFNLHWKSRIETFEANSRFVDVQETGMYKSWWHEHKFEDVNGHTRVTDTVYYTPPLGAIANAAMVSNRLKEVFAYRMAALKFRFNSVNTD